MGGAGQTSGRPLLEKREKWRTPQLFRSLLNRGPGLYSAADVAHPPSSLAISAETSSHA
jgi:hypothetical protein